MKKTIHLPLGGLNDIQFLTVLSTYFSVFTPGSSMAKSFRYERFSKRADNTSELHISVLLNTMESTFECKHSLFENGQLIDDN